MATAPERAWAVIASAIAAMSGATALVTAAMWRATASGTVVRSVATASGIAMTAVTERAATVIVNPTILAVLAQVPVKGQWPVLSSAAPVSWR